MNATQSRRTAPRSRAGLTLGALLLLGLVLAPPPARAAGFLIYDITGEAIGKASAVVASTREPAAVWFNPAAISFLPGYQFTVGGTMATASNQFTPEGATKSVTSESQVFFLPAIFATANLSDRWAVGLGGYSVFGLGIKWPDNWVGREYALNASIQTFTINPTVSFKLLPNVSLAAGLQVVRGAVDLSFGLPQAVSATGFARIGGGAWGLGGNAALLWRILPEVLHAGLTYRSRVKLDFSDGRAEFNGVPPEFQSNPALQDQGGKSAITLPDIISVGFMYKPRPRIELDFDVNLTLWETYDKLALDFAKPGVDTKTLIRNNKPAGTFRLGAEWATPVEGLHARIGFIFDQNPSPKEYLAPSLPDANRVDFALGLGYNTRRFKVDLGYLLVYFLATQSKPGANQPIADIQGPTGTYNSVAHLLSLTLTVRLDQPKPAPKVVD